MKKQLMIIAAVIIVLIAAGMKLTNKTNNTPTESISTGSLTTGVVNTSGIEYTIGSQAYKHTQIYGVTVASNLSSLVASNGGVVSSLSCLPGATVKKGSVVATITPANDIQQENSFIQQGFLQQQAALGEQGIQATLNNLTIQSQTLQNQKRVSEEQLALQKTNLINLQQQQQISNGDTTTRIVNTAKSLQNSIRNALTLFDQTFGVTNPSKVFHADAYLGSLNSSGKEDLKSRFPALKIRTEQISSMNSAEAQSFIADATDFFSLAAQVINDSLADDDYLPKSKLDSLYRSFTDTANGLLSAKATFDSLVTNKGSSSLTYDTQINQLQSQIQSTELTISSLTDQIRSLENTRKLQTQQGHSQLLSTQQSLALLQNNLQGESLVAPYDGVVRSVNVQLSNKIAPGTLVCQIVPSRIESVKIQIFSAAQIPYGTVVYFYDDQYTLIASGALTLELPYKDALTQNYIYEFSSEKIRTKEGTKLKVIFDQQNQTSETWIPLSYVTPKLEGYFVTKKTNTGSEDIQVQVGQVDNGMIHITSGLQQGDTIVK